MPPLVFSDLVDFVLLNKGETFFEYKDEIEIAIALKRALDTGCLYYCTDEYGFISGMIMAEKRNNVLFVVENLSMNLKNLKQFARRAKQEFKGYELQWMKHGVYKKHDTNKIYNKLSV